MSRRYRVSFVVDGKGVAPEHVGIRALADDLIDIDRALRAMVGQADEEPLATLIEVRKGSSNYVLGLVDAALRPYAEMNRAVKTGKVEALPDDAREALANLAKRRDAAGHTATLGPSRKGRAPAVEVTTRSKLLELPPPEIMRGETTLYGVVVGVHLKKDDATVTLELTSDGRRLHCRADHKTAMRLGRKLGDEVGVEGEAVWTVDTYELREFRIREVTAYERRSIDDIMAEGRELGPFFEGMTSEEVMRELRWGDE